MTKEEYINLVDELDEYYDLLSDFNRSKKLDEHFTILRTNRNKQNINAALNAIACAILSYRNCHDIPTEIQVLMDQISSSDFDF